MEPRKVLIVDPAEEFRDALARALAPAFSAVCCSRGDEALAQLQDWTPEVLILELSLAGLDGIGLLRQLPRPVPVLVTTDQSSAFVFAALEELGVLYAMRKPCPVEVVAERVSDLARLSRGMDCVDAAELLVPLGLPSGRQGFQHLLTGLPLLSENRDQRMSKELYASIARRDGGNEKSVEKAIRDAIRNGWESGDRAVWQRYFPGATRCPRNKEFLFRMADQLRRRRCG